MKSNRNTCFHPEILYVLFVRNENPMEVFIPAINHTKTIIVSFHNIEITIRHTFSSDGVRERREELRESPSHREIS